MSQTPPPRLESVNQVRAYQREWLDATRKSVANGGHFAI